MTPACASVAALAIWLGVLMVVVPAILGLLAYLIPILIGTLFRRKRNHGQGGAEARHTGGHR